MLGNVVERACFCCPPLPSAMLIVLKKIWGHNVDTKPGGMGGEKMRHFYQLLRLCPKSFDQGCLQNPSIGKSLLKVKKRR